MGAMTATNKRDAIVTVTPALGDFAGTFRAVRCTLAGSTAYATGGDTLPDLGLKEVYGIIKVGNTAPAGLGNTLQYTGGKVKVTSGGSDTEVTAATDLHTSTWDVIVLGRH